MYDNLNIFNSYINIVTNSKNSNNIIVNSINNKSINIYSLLVSLIALNLNITISSIINIINSNGNNTNEWLIYSGSTSFISSNGINV